MSYHIIYDKQFPPQITKEQLQDMYGLEWIDYEEEFQQQTT